MIDQERQIATIKAALDHMDRAGGDRDGMPECPWCQAGPENDDTHRGDCELVAAREALAALQSSPSREEREQALREYGKSIHLRHMGAAGASKLLADADECLARARRLLKLDPTPTEETK